MLLEGCRKASGRVDNARLAPLGSSHVALPLGALDLEQTALEVEVRPLECDDLAVAEAGVTTEQS